ncbi:MAG: winged helix-turn-helix transcriptional regulator [Rickettsiales bacterium]|nr:winged helix-turn-helix transcriptional regulator [Rickettsiales bacterium]
MKKGKINIIEIYSQSRFIQDLLAQIYEEISVETFSYSALTFTNTESIAIIDIKNQMVFDDFIKLYLDLPVLYPVIILLPDGIKSTQKLESNLVTIIPKPLDCRILIKTIDSCSAVCLYRFSDSLFLDTKTLNIIKILDKKRIETKLTQIEYKILKYLIELKQKYIEEVVTEKEIATNVLGYHALSNTNTIKTHMHRLRQKLGADSSIIKRRINKYSIDSFQE